MNDKDFTTADAEEARQAIERQFKLFLLANLTPGHGVCLGVLSEEARNNEPIQ